LVDSATTSAPRTPTAADDDVALVERFDDVRLAKLPDGLSARVRRQLRVDDRGRDVEIRDRRGRTKLNAIFLYSDATDTSVKLSASELTFLLGAHRRDWPTIVARLGRGDEQRAFSRACELIRAGAVELECEVDGVQLQRPLRWRLTPAWERRRPQRATRRTNERASWQTRAQHASEQLQLRYPQLAHALSRHSGPVERRVLVHAAEDLIAGRMHHGPRAFSQQHFGTTKARDDVDRILVRCGVEDDAQIELGVRRAGRTGLAGPIELRSATGYVNFAGLKGPTDIRLDQDALTLTSPAEVLIVIENRQAAETVSDRFSDHALFWTQGMMGPDSLAALDQLTADRERVLVFPDADLGGVRIAQQVLRVASTAEVIDIGNYPHQPRKPFAADSVSEIGLKAAAAGPAGALAVSCLRRGYPVEQELAAADAVADRLSA
jgi:hypothetical protein